MSCVFNSDVMANVERLQSLIALETTLDDELDELEHQYSLNLLKLDWLQKIGQGDLCHIVIKNNDKTESLLRMYRPMLQDACAEKMELIRSIMEGQRIDGSGDELDDENDVMDADVNMDDGEGHFPGVMSESIEGDGDSNDDAFGMRCT